MKALSVALLCIAASCDTPTEPVQPTLQFTGLVVFGIATLETRAEGHRGGIDVSGVLPTPTAQYSLFGTLEAPGSRQLVLQIDARNDHAGAPFPVQNLYLGQIRNLASGNYDLQVFETVHVDAAQPELVFHQTVHVP
jgi:hypothetical protein